jgi:ATP-dependent Lon protease
MSESSTIVSRNQTGTIVRTGNGQQTQTIPHVLPILPLRNLIVFPGTVLPMSVGRPRSKALLDEVMPGDKLVGVITQKNPEEEDPSSDGLHATGVAASILKLLKLSDGNQSIIVHGIVRFRLKSVDRMDPFLLGKIEVLDEQTPANSEFDALVSSVRAQANRVVELSPNTPDEVQQVINSITAPSALADFLAANLNVEINDKLKLLEDLNVESRLRAVAARLAQQLDVLELQSKIQSQVKESIDKNQRRYWLQEQMKAIRKELGEADGDGNTEADNLRTKIEAANPPENVMKEANRELARLESIPQASPEYGVIRSYLQIIGELPWSKESTDIIDLAQSQKILDRDHHDLEKVKRRIIEYLAVLKLKRDQQTGENVGKTPAAGAILCFVGPPGVGKTSLGKSIAESMGRKFVRVALGGVRDEADIRGHRRTYIGSMPGRLISELRKCGTRNPVMMLDEIDKLGADFRGDPGSALLEVLDPAQNHTFTDHYLDVPFDLSKVLFIATANSMDSVPGPLRDRMEVIDIPGYTQTDKLAIARQYIVPRQLEANGLQKKQATFLDPALKLIIKSYTREAGVRNLERNVGSVARSIAAEVVKGTATSIKVDPKYVEKVLGPARYEPELADRTSVPGIATGLAYTPVGGEILFIEASKMAGKGGVTLTGQIGDVMKESATAALSLIKSRAQQMNIDAKQLNELDIHIHVPAGAVPKDGPSAGIAMFTALSSLLLNKPVRPDVAMTGEITLRGLVLPIGGLKEKTLAARQAGIREVIIPKRNAKDMPELPKEVLDTLKFHLVETADQVLQVALGLKMNGKLGR